MRGMVNINLTHQLKLIIILPQQTNKIKENCPFLLFLGLLTAC
jgi:hypothetical protein